MRRTRLALLWSLGVLAGCGLFWGGLRLLSKGREYQAGEEVEGITRDLEKPAAGGGQPMRFTEVSQEAGLGGFISFAGERTSQLPEDMGGGAAWGDFDNDGDDDLFLVSAGGALGAPEASLAVSRLYENQGNGKFVPYAGFPELRIRGMGAAWADADNDGWLDLAVTGYDTIRLYRNQRGRFELSTAIRPAPGFWTGASWGDFNRDGWPDLYICGYVKYRFDASQRARQSQQFGQSVPHTLNPSSYEPERNLLFQNDGKGGFREVGRAQGVDNPKGRSLSGLWHDFNDDGWMDLYVANDISESKLFLNREGRFEDAGSSAWVAEYRGSMGLAAADFDRDGDEDLFISHWVAQQFALYESLFAQQALLKKGGEAGAPALHFTDVAEIKGIGQPTLRSIGWGAEFGDFDSDGWVDLMVAAGSTFEAAADRKKLVGMPSFLFRNVKGERFELVNTPGLPLMSERVSRGLAVSDYDGDGDLDAVIVDLDGGVRLLRNETAHGRWLQLQARGRPERSWSGADGAQVTAWVGPTPLRRTISSSSYLSQSSRTVHIGLGEAKGVDRVTIRWPDGTKEESGPLSAGRVWQWRQGQPPGAPMSGTDDKERQVAFWDKHRAAMDRLKRDGDPKAAAALFREALALNPRHEDGHYYLASCLAEMGDAEGAIGELRTLLSINPASHRAMQRLAHLHAREAKSTADLGLAAQEAERAHALNPEETGALLLLAEIELLRGNQSKARGHLERVVRTNHRAALAFFLLAYLDSRRGDAAGMRGHLAAVVKSRGPEWKPRGSANEGDVQRRMHEESSLLASYADLWDGKGGAQPAFAALAGRLGGGKGI